MSRLNILMYQTILPFLSRQKQQFSICIIFQSRKIPCSYIKVKNKLLSKFCYLTHDIKSFIPQKSSCTGYNIAAFVSSHSHPESLYIYEIGVYLGMAKTFFIFSMFFFFHFFLSTKTCALSYYPSKNSSYLQRPSSSVKTEQNYIFHRILFSGH